MLGTPAASIPPAICVPKVCCLASACRPRLPPVQRSCCWDPELLLSICCLEADQLLSTLLLSELLPQLLCVPGALPSKPGPGLWVIPTRDRLLSSCIPELLLPPCQLSRLELKPRTTILVSLPPCLSLSDFHSDLLSLGGVLAPRLSVSLSSLLSDLSR